MSSGKSPFEDDERFDGLYMNVAQTARGIEPLLDTVFGFLRRKTDFFAGPPGAEDGTQAAIAKVQQVLAKHTERYQADHQKSKPKPSTKAKSAAKTTTTKPASPKPPKATPPKEEDVIEMGTDGGFDVSSSTPTESKPAAKAPASAAASDATAKEATPATAPNAASPEDAPKEEAAKDSKPPVGNGGTVPGKYVWTQTLAEVSVTIPVPENTRGRDLNVMMAKSKLRVALKTKPAPNSVIVDGPLCKAIIVDDSFWTVEDGNRLVINLQKSNEMEWWDCVVQGDPKIDVKTIQPENSSLGDLDGETRKTVEKMMFDQRQKALGLPTSEEQTKLDAIERFKREHPELDFSNAKIS